MQTFFVRHILSFPNGGLSVARHNEIRDDIILLIKQAFYPHCVRGEPLKRLGRSISEDKVHHRGSVLETRGDDLIQVIWEI